MTITTAKPIRPDWRVSDVLGRYPQLLDVLVGASPAFKHLLNPLGRSLRTRLVSVAQAARMAGLEPNDLVRTLNAAAGLHSEPGVPGVAVQSAVSDDVPVDIRVAEDLDVRPLLARGEEPFSTIMASAALVPANAALRLCTTFEPVPLYDVLSRRGFRHAAHQLGPDDWEVVFWRGADSVAGPSGAEGSAQSATAVASAPLASASDDVVRLDVSDLEPPEPMVRILEAAARLGANQTLLVEHRRRPVFLYPQLDAQGFLHVTRELGPGRVELQIQRREETPS
jgi:hypothetical protein